MKGPGGGNWRLQLGARRHRLGRNRAIREVCSPEASKESGIVGQAHCHTQQSRSNPAKATGLPHVPAKMGHPVPNHLEKRQPRFTENWWLKVLAATTLLASSLPPGGSSLPTSSAKEILFQPHGLSGSPGCYLSLILQVAFRISRLSAGVIWVQLGGQLWKKVLFPLSRCRERQRRFDGQTAG